MIYITGDKHADFYEVCCFCKKEKTNISDLMIILGDAGINYFNDSRDYKLKKELSECKITFFCVHGNHEERPEKIKTYKTKEFHNGIVYYEEEYPNILFAKDGEIYNLNNKSVLVIGGAYSVDKEYRIKYGYCWYETEQPDDDIKKRVFEVIKNNNNDIDIVLSHTCPYKYMPREVFMSGVDQSKVDYSTEKFLDEVEKNLNYKKWYCGHFHTEKQIDKIEFMFGRIKDFITGEFVPKLGYNNYEIIRDAFSKKEAWLDSNNPHCPICNSNDIVLQKGDGYKIYGDDTIALICEECKKVYGFNDVKYKQNYPRDL